MGRNRRNRKPTNRRHAPSISLRLVVYDSNPQEQHELQGSRGEANLVWKCGLCGKQNSISTSHHPPPPRPLRHQHLPLSADSRSRGLIDFDKSLDQTKAVYTFEQSENQEFGALAVLECRGCEIVAFDPKVSGAGRGVDMLARLGCVTPRRRPSMS